jgi:hypothetical protein
MKEVERELKVFITRLYKRVAKRFRIKISKLKIIPHNKAVDCYGFYTESPREIHIRLRFENGNWVPIPEILETLAHELAHSAHPDCFEHDRQFYAAYHQIAQYMLQFY